MSKKIDILISLDPSEYSKYTFEWVLQNIIDPQKHKVHVLTVQEDIELSTWYSPVTSTEMAEEFESIRKTVREKAEAMLKAYFKVLKEAFDGKLECEMVLASGDARREIVEYSYKASADLVILGSRGHGAVKRVFVGSTSDYCVHNCNCSVLIVKKPESVRDE
ncbi:MAG: uncharacterized protein A8A55_1297 [Amphiamblys sp. WSBS2006]|nr:MAG: uncharacterized protein A8A55_1297 [Amphiamblys sp. WSBS2006]